MVRRGIIAPSFHPQPRCITSPATMLILPGSNALSTFRTRSLLSQLQAVAPAIVGVTARFYHFIDAAATPSDDDVARLRALLDYGEPFAGSEEGEQLVVIPRFGTISPWASKATDIAHNCGMSAIRRIERGVVYYLSDESRPAGRRQETVRVRADGAGGLLHDRMTETVLRELAEAADLFQHLDAAAAGRRSICRAAARRRWSRPTASSGWRCRTTKSITWSRHSSAAGAQPDRRRADDVRAGQLRALPPQDFQRRLDHRRREAGQVAVRDDHEYPPVAAEGHHRRLSATIRR